jgi:hypothetical protein
MAVRCDSTARGRASGVDPTSTTDGLVPSRSRSSFLIAAACSALSSAVAAQQRDTTARPDSGRPPAAATPQPAKTPQLEFSGILFANWNYRTDRAARAQNRFDVERAYLTFRMPVGDRTSVRITADVFQQTTTPGDAFYRGWAFRAKYAYLQYDYLRDYRGTSAYARLGMLHTVVIEHIETFWPRWLSRTAVELNGFFASADLGAATQVNLPSKRGELYATVTNGPGYTSRETDRFKDAGVRLTLTPFASGKGLFSTTAITAWGYKGAIASRFVTGGAGQVGPVGEGVQRDRWGVFAGLKDRRVTLGGEWAQRANEGELGNNTLASPRVVVDSTGTLVSAFAIVRPVEWLQTGRTSKLALLGRYDRFRFVDDAAPASRLIIAGLIWDLDRRLSLAADYQQLLPRDGAPGSDTKTWFVHALATF